MLTNRRSGAARGLVLEVTGCESQSVSGVVIGYIGQASVESAVHQLIPAPSPASAYRSQVLFKYLSPGSSPLPFELTNQRSDSYPPESQGIHFPF